jgi:hypothetical protein
MRSKEGKADRSTPSVAANEASTSRPRAFASGIPES